MAPISKIAPMITRLLGNYKGAKMTLELPSKALADIAKSNPNRIGAALTEVAARYPKGITSVSSEIGDQFIRTTATMRNNGNVVGELSFNGDANIIDSILKALKGGGKKIENIPCHTKELNLEALPTKLATKNLKSFNTGQDPLAQKAYEKILKSK